MCIHHVLSTSRSPAWKIYPQHPSTDIFTALPLHKSKPPESGPARFSSISPTEKSQYTVNPVRSIFTRCVVHCVKIFLACCGTTTRSSCFDQEILIAELIKTLMVI